MKTFTLLGFADHLAKLPTSVIAEQHRALEEAARVVRDEAKSLIGDYQAGAGPFSGWAPLAQSTQDEREKEGYSRNEPLLRDGTLRDSIEYTVGLNFWIGEAEAAVGVPSKQVSHPYGSGRPVDIGDVAVWQELGTSRIPPRSFLGIAGAQKGSEVAEICGGYVVMALAGMSGSYKKSIP